MKNHHRLGSAGGRGGVFSGPSLSEFFFKPIAILPSLGWGASIPYWNGGALLYHGIKGTDIMDGNRVTVV